MKVVMKWITVTTILIVLIIIYEVVLDGVDPERNVNWETIRIPSILLAADFLTKAALLILVKTYVYICKGRSLTAKSLNIMRLSVGLIMFVLIAAFAMFLDIILNHKIYDHYIIPIAAFGFLAMYRFIKSEITLENNVVYIDITYHELNP